MAKTAMKNRTSQSTDPESVRSPIAQPTSKPATMSVGKDQGHAAGTSEPSQNVPEAKRKRTRSKRPKLSDQPPPPNTTPAAHNLEDVFSVSYGKPGTTFPDRPDPISQSATAALNVAKANKRKFGAMDPKPPIHAEPPSEQKAKRRRVGKETQSKDEVQEIIDQGVPPATALTAALPSVRELKSKGDEIMEALEKDKQDLKENYGGLANSTGERAIAVKKRKADGYSPPQILKPSRSPTPLYVSEREKQNALRRSGERARKRDDRFEQTLKKQDQLDREERDRDLDALSRNEKVRAQKEALADKKAKTLVKADTPAPKLSPRAMQTAANEDDSDIVKRNRLNNWRMEVAEGTQKASTSSLSTAIPAKKDEKKQKKAKQKGKAVF